MKLRTKTMTVYTSEDGNEYTDHMVATMADLKHILDKEGLKKEDVPEIATAIFNNREQIADLFKTFNKINSQKVAG